MKVIQLYNFLNKLLNRYIIDKSNYMNDKNTNPNDTQIVVRVSKEAKDQLKRLAKKNNTTLTKIFKQTISQLNN